MLGFSDSRRINTTNMQRERDIRDGVSLSRDLSDSFQGFGSRRSMFPSLFGGRDPFDDPFFSRPLGSTFESSIFGPSAAFSGTPQGGGAKELLVEELNSDDEGGEDKVTEDGRDNCGKQSISSKEPTIEHPDDVEDGN